MLSFTKESILNAISKVEAQPEIRNKRESEIYDLVYNEKRYPPVLIISEAHKLLGGEELTIRDFNNSAKTAFKILIDLGFEIIKKNENFFDDLQAFIAVADSQITGEGTTTDATTYNRERKKEYKNLKVEVSFGKGRATSIPWISFLENGQTTSNGYYPVYLYYKKLGLLILAYGISEKNIPNNIWNLKNAEKIEAYFAKNKLFKPENYGSSFVYKVYNIKQPLNEKEINLDLNNIIQEYQDSLIINRYHK